MNLQQISEMVAALSTSHTVTDLSVRQGPTRLVIRRALTVAQPAPSAEEPASRPMEGVLVRSHLVGIFHARASEKQPPVTVGTVVREGQVLGAIESMRMLYEVTASAPGSVAEVLVEDGQPVEYGQELFRILPSPADGAK